MAEFYSWRSYRIFASSVKRAARYVFEKDVEDFLQIVLDTSRSRRRDVPSKRIFWRAQQGHAWDKQQQDSKEFEIPGPYSPQRMKPLRHAAREGRVNPKGIPCLYLATDKETAMAEVRPWIGSYLSVGQFKTVKDLVLIDCSLQHDGDLVFYFEEPDAGKKERAVWADIDRAFSEPVNPNDSIADYAPTQVLSELFRKNGFDGVAYKSLLGEGFNVTLFDIDAADLINCFLYEVKSVSFKFEQTANPYFVSEHYDKRKKHDS